MSRQSAVFRSSMANTPSSVRVNRVKADPFPLLDVREILSCLESLSFTCSEELLLKPSQQYMLTLFQQILENFLNISERKFYKVINDIDDDNEYLDTLNIVGLQKIIFKFLNQCGIDDFNIMDIIKPDPQRVRRILSCVVNFARFREEQKYLVDELHLKNDDIIAEFKKLTQQIQILEFQISELQNANDSVDLESVEKLNAQLENELRQLKKKQEAITNEHDIYKQDKNSLLKNYEDLSYMLIESQKELDKLKLITNESPDLVLKFNKELSLNLVNEQENLNQLELRSRNLSISLESFNLLEQEFRNYTKILDELQIDINRANSTQEILNKHNSLYKQRQLDLHELERNLQITTRQIENNTNKLERLKQNQEEKRLNSTKNLELLHERYTTLITERDLNEQDLRIKKKQILNFENKITELKLQYQDDIKELNLEILRLNSHIKLYISEMNQKMGV